MKDRDGLRIETKMECYTSDTIRNIWNEALEDGV